MSTHRITGAAMVAGIAGNPVAHSLSPVIHNAWLAAGDIDGAYVPFAPADAAGFEALVAAAQADADPDDQLIEQANTAPLSVYGFGHEGYYRNVLSTLRGSTRPETDGRGGRKSLELILGIYESARTGQEVAFPLK